MGLLSLISVCLLLVFDISLLRYYSTDVGLAFMCYFILVIAHPVCHFYFVASSLVGSSVPCTTMVQCIHGSPFSHCTATVDPVGKRGIFLLSTSLLTCSFLFISIVLFLHHYHILWVVY